MRRRPGEGTTSDSTQVVGVDVHEWRRYCQEVAAAADLLANTARRAEGAALVAGCLDNSEALRRVREFSFGSMFPRHDAQITTYATTLLGCFAALEALRRRLIVHD